MIFPRIPCRRCGIQFTQTATGQDKCDECRPAPKEHHAKPRTKAERRAYAGHPRYERW